MDIVNSKPLERRVIFEEAAGVLKYKKRKEESFRKLEHTNENLARVNLLIDELLTTLTPLKDQSEKAKKYLEYRGELESTEIALIASDIEKLNEETMGELIYFFELACAMSGRILGVNPFNQPGVEEYKKNMFKLLGKPGYENK